jgi:hypothetical protein
MRGLYVLYVSATAHILAASCVGCVPKERIIQGVENSDAVRQYSKLLEPCKARARAAKDIAEFDKCSDNIDAMLCMSNAAFCNDGGR